MRCKSEPASHPFLAEADIDIPVGWHLLLEELVQTLGAFEVPETFRLTKVQQFGQYMFVGLKPSDLDALSHDQGNALIEELDDYSRRAASRCMTCGGYGRPLFRQIGWCVHCEEHAPTDALDLHSKFDDLPTTSADSHALHAAYPELPWFQFQAGWLSLIERLMIELYAAGFDTQHYRVTQLKEKFGTLRFYIDSSDPDKDRERLINALIDVACDRSISLCERCGRDGSLWINIGYWTTVCSEHVPKGAKTPRAYFRSQ